MPRKRRVAAKARLATEVSDAVWAWLNDEPKQAWIDGYFEVLDLEQHEEKLRSVWESVETELLDRWIADKPGTRPAIWWRVVAPRQPVGTFPGRYYDGTLPEPRKLLTGKGCPAWEKLAYGPSYDHGLPTLWYDVHPDDSPTFEAEATYLERYGFLTAAEKKVLQQADYAPVTVEYEFDHYLDYYRQRDAAKAADRSE